MSLKKILYHSFPAYVTVSKRTVQLRTSEHQLFHIRDSLSIVVLDKLVSTKVKMYHLIKIYQSAATPSLYPVYLQMPKFFVSCHFPPSPLTFSLVFLFRYFPQLSSLALILLHSPYSFAQDVPLTSVDVF